jgi:hypothetical protein
MGYQFKNNASALLAQSLPSGQTTLLLNAGQGELFPALAGGDSCQLTITAVDGTQEVVTCTARTDDLLTVTRGQEGTAQGSFAVGDRVELRLTAAVAENFVQRTGSVMLGDLDMGGHSLLNADLDVDSLSIDELQIGALLALDGGATNKLVIPSGGGRPTIGGAVILTTAILRNMIFPWTGTIPSYLKLCDGTLGTPDLRDKMIIGAGPSHTADSTGGSWTGSTNSTGDHNHDGSTGGVALTGAQLPALNVSAPEANTESGSDVQRVHDVSVSYSGTPGAAHSHSIATGGAHSHTVTYKPPYYALAYCMLNLP